MNQMKNEILEPAVKAKNIGLINASVTHMGILTHQGAQPWHPAPEALKAAGRAAAKLCEQRGASLPELAIQFALQNEHVDVTLLGTRTTAELEATLPLLDKAIDEELLMAVQELIEPVRNMSWSSGR
jgi:L-galactose dehydrogenase